MNSTEAARQRDQIISQIKKYVPLIRPFLELSEPLRDYSNRLYDFEVSDVHRSRQKLVTEVITKKLQQLYGTDALQKLRVSFSDNLAVNIVDHHQVLNHPLLIPSNIISSASKIGANTPQDAIISISSGDVPPNNYFSKNGFQFHDIRIPFFSVSEREYSSYYIPKRTFNFIERLKEVHRWEKFSHQEQEFLQQLQDRITSTDFSRCNNYIDQVTVLVQQMWPLMFEEKLRPTLPNLLYTTQEEFTTKCLIRLLSEDTYISSTLFDKQFRQQVLDNFRGIVVTWNEQDGKGTHFFWRKYPDEPRSLRMYLEGDKLVPSDSRMAHLAVPLERETIIDLLQRREIYPSLFLIFSVLNFYAGVKPLVGHGSVVYLTLFKQAWEKTLQNSDFKDEVERINDVETNGLIVGIPLFFKRNGDSLKTLYATDLMFNGGVTKDYLDKIFQTPFKDLFSIGITGVYDYYSQKYVPEQERIKPTISYDELASLVLSWI